MRRRSRKKRRNPAEYSMPEAGDSAVTEAELVFTHILACERTRLYLDYERTVPAVYGRRIAAILSRRVTGEPLQYILGRAGFMGFEFAVAPSVLIPRPETEILVEAVMAYIDRRRRTEEGKRKKRLDLIDVGTGSGCIAVALAKLVEDVRITALDISEPALNVARENARMLCVDKKIAFLTSDFCAMHQAPCAMHRFDIVVSNPPYIRSAEIDTLQAEVRQEPREALDGGPDGLAFYRRLLARSPEIMHEDGVLIVEIGCGQLEGLRVLIDASGCLRIREVIKDYAGIDRVVVIEHG